MPLDADLYLDRIDLTRYVGSDACQICHVESLSELLDRLRSGRIRPGQCPHWPPERIEAFRMAVDAGRVLPVIPSLSIPRPTGAGWLDLNRPNEMSPVLVTGNSQLTHEVLMAVLSTTTAPMWLLSVDTGGHTVDMSLVYRTFTPVAIVEAFRAVDRPASRFVGRIILPGLASSHADSVSERLGQPVEVGPVCAAELPLFFGNGWRAKGSN